MAQNPTSPTGTLIVEEQVEFTLFDLSRACRVQTTRVVALVEEGVLDPTGHAPDAWRFSGLALRRALTALRLERDLDLNPAGTALVMDLLDEIESLRSRLHRTGMR